MKKLLLTLALVLSGSMNLVQAMDDNSVPIHVQNQLIEQAPQRWTNLSAVDKAKVNTATAILIPLAFGYMVSALFAPEPVTKGLNKIFGPVVKVLENQTRY